MGLDNILKVLGIVWSAVFFVCAVAFFFGGEWSTWIEIRNAYKSGKLANNSSPAPDLTLYVKYGDPIAIKGPEGFLWSNNGRGKDELDVVISGTSQPWSLQRP